MGGALASPASFASGLVALVALAVSTKLPVPVLFGFWLGLCLGLSLWLGYTRWGAPPAADPRYAKKKFGKIGKFRGGANPKDPRYANGVIISVEDAEVIAWAREAGGSALGARGGPQRLRQDHRRFRDGDCAQVPGPDYDSALRLWQDHRCFRGGD